jgi:hypothetical protein
MSKMSGEALKDDVADLTEGLTASGADALQEVASRAGDRIEDLKAAGTETVQNVERGVKKRPGRSLLVAVCACLAGCSVAGGRGGVNKGHAH